MTDYHPQGLWGTGIIAVLSGVTVTHKTQAHKRCPGMKECLVRYCTAFQPHHYTYSQHMQINIYVVCRLILHVKCSYIGVESAHIPFCASRCAVLHTAVLVWALLSMFIPLHDLNFQALEVFWSRLPVYTFYVSSMPTHKTGSICCNTKSRLSSKARYTQMQPASWKNIEVFTTNKRRRI